MNNSNLDKVKVAFSGFSLPGARLIIPLLFLAMIFIYIKFNPEPPELDNKEEKVRVEQQDTTTKKAKERVRVTPQSYGEKKFRPNRVPIQLKYESFVEHVVNLAIEQNKRELETRVPAEVLRQFDDYTTDPDILKCYDLWAAELAEYLYVRSTIDWNAKDSLSGVISKDNFKLIVKMIE